MFSLSDKHNFAQLILKWNMKQIEIWPHKAPNQYNFDLLFNEYKTITKLKYHTAFYSVRETRTSEKYMLIMFCPFPDLSAGLPLF